MTSYNNKAITYNANGEVASYDGWNYNWNKGKLSSITTKSNARALKPTLSPSKTYSFTYNALGQRITSNYSYFWVDNGLTPIVQGEVTNYSKTFYYDHSGRLISETISKTLHGVGNESESIVFLYDESSIIGMVRTASGVTNAYYFQRNLLGDVIAIYDTNGTKIVEYAYDAWGNCTIKGTTTNYVVAHANPIRYRGYYYDEDTKLYYLNARYYSPEFRRFISLDDTTYLVPQNVNGCNLYAYCGNNPVMFVDPSGHFPWLVLVVALLLFTPVGGVALQSTVTTASYTVITVASIFDEDIRNDMNEIGWNPFNSDADAVLNSNYVSFYKGVPVFRANVERSGSFGAIILQRAFGDENPYDTLNHERGHSSQLMMMGIATYGFTVGIPSPLKLGIAKKHYYDAPWEAMADILGGVTYRFNFKDTEQNAWDYYWKSMLFFPSVVSYW